jgi:GrpB-like predicted nucleotidyltransferase (UPF0157 family)
MTDGPPSQRITVVPYDPRWPELFAEERRLLERILGPWLAGGVHHIGSTAVPGLAAKPLIDIIAGVRDLQESRAADERLEQAGYVYTPHRPHEAHHFAKPSASWRERTHNLHLTEVGSALWRERLTFRDALRADPVLAAGYAALKQRLAAQCADGADYASGKRAFVEQVLVSAGVTPAPRQPGAGADHR